MAKKRKTLRLLASRLRSSPEALRNYARKHKIPISSIRSIDLDIEEAKHGEIITYTLEELRKELGLNDV